MAYQIKRSNRVVEDVELCDSNGNVLETIHVDLDIDSIAGRFRKQYIELVAAERAAKAKQKSDISPENMNEAFEEYGNALITLLKTVFGDEGTTVILNFFESRYIEISIQVFPFIRDDIMPAVEKVIAESKTKIKQKFNRQQRRAISFGKRR